VIVPEVKSRRDYGLSLRGITRAGSKGIISAESLKKYFERHPRFNFTAILISFLKIKKSGRIRISKSNNE
jgi:hypothetical protein